MNILIPKEKYNLPSLAPVFFLAGPVRGGDDWQKIVAERLLAVLPKSYVAIPYYHAEDTKYPLAEHAMMGNGEVFPRQLNWEHHYLNLASVSGCIIFWLPAESKTDPRKDGMYARDTRGEVGEWRGRLIGNPKLKVVIGGEEGFDGFSQIKRNFHLALGEDFPIYPNIRELVVAAVNKAIR